MTDRAVTPWELQGCAACRRKWERAEALPKIGIDADAHETWYRCDVCHSFWIETERYAVAVPTTEAVARFGPTVLDD